ncbi:uncharacterized protein LDX57_009427 [Aspergillus melleus]|uniref:uncharacterized protein n=1 Tax=Aspergillus melleus TaxID=138277 RepID=UPI001E8D7E90|nr:uncharacterized protein LDX57_009427 [Aspergillus melleus]KAH8431774.1 hypothetical protein LDX57_009427 [Aspergillus melleus]
MVVVILTWQWLYDLCRQSCTITAVETAMPRRAVTRARPRNQATRPQLIFVLASFPDLFSPPSSSSPRLQHSLASSTCRRADRRASRFITHRASLSLIPPPSDPVVLRFIRPYPDQSAH